MSIQKPSKNSNYLRQPKKPFEMIYRQVLDKLKNSDALAVYCHLAGKPDNWEINDQYIMNHFGWGRDKARNTINCLIVNKLIKRTQLIDEHNKFCGRITELLDGYDFNTYIEYDKKIHKNLCEYQQKSHLSTENNPSPEKPSYGSSVDGKQTATIEDIKAFKKEYIKRESTGRPKRAPLSDDFIFNDENQKLCLAKQIEPALVLDKFKAHSKAVAKQSVDWQAEAKLWITRERPPTLEPVKKEMHSNVIEWGPGHPTWEANQKWKENQTKEVKTHGCGQIRDQSRGSCL